MSLKTEYEILQEEKRYNTIVSLLGTISEKKDDDSEIEAQLKLHSELLRSLLTEIKRPVKVEAPAVTVQVPGNGDVTSAVEKLSTLLIKSNEELQRLYFKKEMITSFDVKYNAAGDIDKVNVNYQTIK